MRLGSLLVAFAVLSLTACTTTRPPDGSANPPTRAPIRHTLPPSLLAPSRTPRPDATPAGAGCTRTLQSIVDGATSGSTVHVPSCLYRETVTVNRPMTLIADAGAEIRGSDVWQTWTPSGTTWVSRQAVPEFPSHGRCVTGSERCLWPEQVFVDGDPLLQIGAGSTPSPGQFSVDGERRVVLGDDPSRKVVEVTTRRYWIVPRVDNIIIDGFRMRHAANDSQEGAINDDSHEVWIRNCRLSDTHGAVVSLRGVGGIQSSDIFRGGQLGIHKGGSLVQGNDVHDNNTEDFDPGWEAGGMKAALVTNMTIDGNRFFTNRGPGIWIDIRSDNITITNNHVFENQEMGIFFEISSNGHILSNVVWGNSRDDESSWVTGAGILLHSSGSTEVSGNFVAWNSDGIGFQSQDRDDRPSDAYVDNFIHDNVIIQEDGEDKWGLAWAQDWAGPLFAPESNNQGANNLYWFPNPEGTSRRFSWEGPIGLLAEFNQTPGEENGVYLTDEEKDAELTALGIPTDPAAL